MATLTQEQIVTIEVLHQRDQSHCQTARILGGAGGILEKIASATNESTLPTANTVW